MLDKTYAEVLDTLGGIPHVDMMTPRAAAKNVRRFGLGITFRRPRDASGGVATPAEQEWLAPSLWTLHYHRHRRLVSVLRLTVHGERHVVPASQVSFEINARAHGMIQLIPRDVRSRGRPWINGDLEPTDFNELGIG